MLLSYLIIVYDLFERSIFVLLLNSEIKIFFGFSVLAKNNEYFIDKYLQNTMFVFCKENYYDMFIFVIEVLIFNIYLLLPLT